jgi:hypothetical protein
MNICHILPLAYLKDPRFSNLNKYHLVEFDEFCNNKEYADYYKSLDRSKNFIMFDCSVGIGKVFDIVKDTPDYIEAAKELRPHELIIPDALQDNKQTIFLLKEFYPKYIVSGLKELGVKTMGVLQLETIDDLDPTIKAFQACYVDTYGIPWKIDWLRPTPDKSDIWLIEDRLHPDRLTSVTRSRVLNRISLYLKLLFGFHNNVYGRVPMHLLGCADAIEYAFIKDARSTDTSTAYLHSKEYCLYTDKGLPCEKLSGVIDFKDPVAELKVLGLLHNIEVIDNFIRG